MEVTGKLIVKNETKEFGNNGFTKREFVIETDSQYPQKILIELIKGKCSLLDAFEVGQVIKVHYNLNGREWVNPQGETKYFNSIQGWRIENVGANEKVGSAVDAHKANGPVAESEEGDDLPF